MSWCPFKEYSTIFGKPNEGIHSYRIFDLAIMDIIFTNQNMFYTHIEDNPYFDNWFMFQRLLL